MYLKSNETGVTKKHYFNSRQQTRYLILWSNFPLSLMLSSKRCWKDSPGMVSNSVVTAILMASMASKWVPLIIPLILEKIRVTRKKFKWDCPRTTIFFSAGNCSMFSTFSPVTFQTSSNLRWNISNSVLFRVQLTWKHSNSQPTFTTRHLSYPLGVDLSYLLKASRSKSHFSLPRDALWTICATQKHQCAKWCYRHTLINFYFLK